MVIDGHVIPNHVLFTAPTEDSVEFQTLAHTDTLKVTISFSTENDGKEVRSMYHDAYIFVLYFSLYQKIINLLLFHIK